MKCISTRRTAEGYKRRRYVKGDGTRFTTVEVPAEVWDSMNKAGRGNDRVAGWTRAREWEKKRSRAMDHMKQGWKAIASAHQLDVPVRTIQRWRKAARDTPASTNDSSRTVASPQAKAKRPAAGNGPDA